MTTTARPILMRAARLATQARSRDPNVAHAVHAVEHGTLRLLEQSLPKLDRHYARAEEGSRVWLAEARASGVVAPTLLTLALIWVLGLVSMRLLPRRWFILLLIGTLGLIGMTLDASRRARR